MTDELRMRLKLLLAQVQAYLQDQSDHLRAQRGATVAYLIRVASAVIALLSQVLLARWMGSHEFGIYVYVWTWILLLGSIVDFGLATTAQRAIPEYSQRKAYDLVRGFIYGSRWLSIFLATAVAAVAAMAIGLLAPNIDRPLVGAILFGCTALPLYGLTTVQDTIARSYDWIDLALLPLYVFRPLGLLLLVGLAYLAGFSTDAVTVIAAAALATWVIVILQTLMLNRRLGGRVPKGPRSYDFSKWITTSFPMFMVAGFYYLLSYADVIILQHFRSPKEVAIYFAATKLLALVMFVYFAVSAAVAHRFSEYHYSGDRARLAEFVASSIRWTFWPSLAMSIILLIAGRPLLWLFGPEFLEGYPLLFVLAGGLLARAAVGPAEQLLNMLGQQVACAFIYAGAFAINCIACVLLIPQFGMMGAAISITAALICEAIAMYAVIKNRLGLHALISARGPARAVTA